ncbi:hypothetical protein, partial [Pseudomonas synxantha]|uniref:hypothetical protein n=1 Tax=Pseudomonas synxantha TaxID=47883 RepID=UPI00345DA714
LTMTRETRKNAAFSGFSRASSRLQKSRSAASVSAMRSESLLILLLILGAPLNHAGRTQA